jgi:type II secretory pathway pseudopilin PulG
MTSRNCNRRRRSADAFTLVELVIVLLIISAMVTVTIPYATRSSEGRKLEQACRDVAETIKYAMSCAMDTGQATRLAVDVTTGSYEIETTTGITREDFAPLEDSRAGVRYLGPGVRILDHEGFSPVDGKRYALILDPDQPWPQAHLSLVVKDASKTIRITGKRVEIEG